ncbi:hypothetical protein DB30_07773 [Enhygromyxa salina]|uniref:Uncharacterized protein n=1 Tax=Enhygromyxa salina TaxID=215803 RepID=A0A0C2A5V2_9BACT|nr:hypothetical protein [Enhygromyxa salina]KIG18758.1 hypothetical protein DB30_07773 [Enhygromyxa salina]
MIELTEAQRAHLAADVRRRLDSCVPWNRKLVWAPELNIQAHTYPTVNLFAEVAPTTRGVEDLREGEYVDSDGGQFRYAVRLHRRGAPLETWWGRKTGTVVFDGDIEIPILFERQGPGLPFRKFPWMSLTPAEMLTLRPGTKLAKGRVVIAGLGLAHQLIEVGKRRAVTEITVVERSRELVELIMPRAMAVLAKQGCEQVRVTGGDAFKLLPTLQADVALVDVFPAYGDNRVAMADLRKRCKGIARMWDWGASDLL